jgi:RNA polymerase-binding transcription factor DksA
MALSRMPSRPSTPSLTVREAIERKLAVVQQRLRRLEADRALGEPPRHSADELDLALELGQHDARSDELERLRTTVWQLRRALRRVRDGQSQLCEDCGVTIPTARLLAVPGVATCRGCQEAREHTGPAGPRAHVPRVPATGEALTGRTAGSRARSGPRRGRS